MVFSRTILFLVFCNVLALCACGTTGDSGGDGDQETSDRETYPEGPYGVSEGDIIDNLSFTDSEGAPFQFEDMFSDENNKLLLLSTAAGWCTACREEQIALQSLLHQAL